MKLPNSFSQSLEWKSTQFTSPSWPLIEALRESLWREMLPDLFTKPMHYLVAPDLYNMTTHKLTTFISPLKPNLKQKKIFIMKAKGNSYRV